MKKFRVPPQSKIRLKDWDPAYHGKHDEEHALPKLRKNRDRIADLQPLLYAEKKHSLLIVLQGLDSSGKDGAIKNLLSGVSPQGVHAVAFKQPTPTEQAHDFLWRIHPHTPARGMISVFNRSYFEDVLVTRVHKLVEEKVWARRFQIINEFEHGLAADGTTILKFFLHLSKKEQLERFRQRLEDPAKQWKISETDYSDRELWDKYQQAYEDVLRRTSTEQAPWHIIPADNKWFRDLAITEIVASTLEDLKLKAPPPTVDLAKIRKLFRKSYQSMGK